MAEVEPAIVELRPMGIGDILDATFRLYKRHLVPFLTIAFVAYLPYALYTLAIGLAYGPEPVSGEEVFGVFGENTYRSSAQADSHTILSGLGNFVFMLIVIPLAQAALIFNISGSILGERITAGAAFGRAAGRLLPLFWTQFLVGIVVMIGFVLLFVPGIIFSLWFMIIAPVVVLERINGSPAMTRSRELMKGNLGKGFLLSLVLFLMSWAILFGAGFVFGLLPGVPQLVFEIGFLIIQGILLPIQMAPLILLYYELRVRKEAFDLERLAASVELPPTPPVPPMPVG